MKNKTIKQLEKELKECKSDSKYNEMLCDGYIKESNLHFMIACILGIALIVTLGVGGLHIYNLKQCGKTKTIYLTPTEHCNLQGFESSNHLDNNNSKFKCYSFIRSGENRQGLKIYDRKADYMVLSSETKTCIN